MDGNAKEALRTLVTELPDEAAVPVPVRWLRALLDGNEVEPEGDVPVDLTVKQVAELFGRHPGTVRGWLDSGVLSGYKLRGREWRITRAALRDFQQRQRGNGSDGPETPARALGRGREPQLDDWRDED